MLTINPSERHGLMAMIMRTGTPEIFVPMDPPERIECVPASSGGNSSLGVSTRWISALRNVMMSEAQMYRIPLFPLVYYLTKVATGHPYSCMRRKMLTPAWTGKASGESDLK